MVSAERARLVKIARIINASLLTGFVALFWLLGAPPWWAAVLAAFLLVPSLDHHYAEISPLLLLVVLLILGSTLMGMRPHWTEFRERDVDGDGYVGAGEFDGPEASFQEADKNGDGRLSRMEFVISRR